VWGVRDKDLLVLMVIAADDECSDEDAPARAECGAEEIDLEKDEDGGELISASSRRSLSDNGDDASAQEATVMER